MTDDLAVAQDPGDDWTPIAHAGMSVAEIRQRYLAHAAMMRTMWVESAEAQALPPGVRRIALDYAELLAFRQAERAAEWKAEMMASRLPGGRILGLDRFDD
jgi:hypothetical protein